MIGAAEMATDNTLLSKDWVLETRIKEELVSTYQVNIKNLMLEMSIGVHPHVKKTKTARNYKFRNEFGIPPQWIF